MLSGTKLGRYEIRQKIGTGGMGEVFLAHDSQLDRHVALKVLLPEFCCDVERVQRFKLEARAASALNHPNIITIHEIDELGDKLFIATEFVDGETLREKIEKGELTFLDSIKIGEQVADALAVAHTAHIVHRDIKPENIMIRRDGYAKILDFGLAKPTHRQSGAEDKTIQMVNTQPGMVMSVSIGGGEAKQLLPDDEFSQLSPEMSADGKHIAYFSFRFDEQTLTLQNKLTICEFDGKEIGKVEKEIPISFGKHFAWSPDGKSFTFVNMDGTPNLSNYPLDTSKPKPLTDFNSGKIIDFSWSSDGKKLFIVRGITNSDLVLIKDNGKI